MKDWPTLQQLLAEALASIAVPLLGVLPTHDQLDLPSRHLGLLPAAELPDLDQRAAHMAALAAACLDLERLWPLLAPPALGGQAPVDPMATLLAQLPPAATAGPPLPVAIASDRAFHFRYPEAAELLSALGLAPCPWSPLADEPLPAGCRAVLLPGGYPELWAAELSQAERALASLRQAADHGLPLVAECGGLLLLGEALADPQGRWQPMAGVLPFRAARGALSLGYRQARCRGDGLLTRSGERWCGHEFHRWQLQPGQAPARGAVAASHGLWQLEGWGSPMQEEGWTAPNVHASWLHLHWAGCPAIPRRLAVAAANAAPLPTADGFCRPANPDPRFPMSAGA
jgi:cobyrinic acid a,c-diamide synthase